ncbi:MAG TPA: 2-hydroxyacyl-CoA dehydratase family protein [Candidatus Lokiarchaeia archaeon]|nr:2-hydroxyacyl-CoA dehydratase family protein [Candidatus Lokiarchaeia archaeon]
MSYVDEDAHNFAGLIRLAVHFLQGRDFLKRKKMRDKMALVSVTFPFNDIIFAAGAVPVFPIRMHEFKTAAYLSALEAGSALAGWDATTKLIQFAHSFKAGKNLVRNLIIEVIEAVNEKYNELAAMSESLGYGVDSCYGVKGMYGMYYTKGKNLDLNLNVMYRCSAFVKYFDTLHDLVPRSHFIELPTYPPGAQSPEVLEFMISELQEAFAALEKVTGKPITSAALRETAQLSNECRKYYRDILFDIGKQDFWPCNPSTFAEILTLLNSTQIDCCSDLKRYRDDLKALVDEMRARIRNGVGMDVSRYKKVVYGPIFGGYEPSVQDQLYELGGRTYYGDWHALGFLQDIELSGDMVRNLANWYLSISGRFGCGNTEFMDSFVSLVQQLGADAVIFNQIFGCRDMTGGYRYFKDRITKELGIPVAMVNFTRIGDGIEQVKTRAQALMEML